MKKTIISIATLLLSLLLAISLVACANGERTGLWENATYLDDQTLGSGAKTLTVEVTAEEKTVTFTVKTDKETVGEALLDAGLIEGEMSTYGIYIKKVNGITADFDVDQTYWAFYINGEPSMNGADQTPIEEGAIYRLAHAK